MIYPPNPREFIIEVPNLHPLSVDYLTFWREQKRRCIEGYWVGGYYMPPALYFYVNFGTIKKNEKGKKVKSLARPNLRDLEWLFFRHYTEAKGFSGFEDDPNISCFRGLVDPLYPEFLYPPHVYRKDGSLKDYEPARTYLERFHPQHYQLPVYDNECKNIMMLGSRNIGKSYMVGAGLIPHEFLFNGATRYTEETITKPQVVEILVGSADSSKSRDILNKTQDCFDFLPGKMEAGGRLYPAPFAKRTSGSWAVNSEVVAAYKKKLDGGWDKSGTKSKIMHKSFNANPFAAQGTRPTLLVVEECGLVAELKEIYQHTRDNLRNDSMQKTGILMMLGTSGDMEKGSLPASEMFYQTEQYDILAMEDTYEFRGNIGFFIPGYLAIGEFKDANGISMIDLATKKIEAEREKYKGTDALTRIIQYHPLVPSEMFLTKSATIFPTPELRNRMTYVQNHKIYELAEKKVDLYFDPNSIYNGVTAHVNPSLKAISKFPYNEDDREGCVVMYEYPHLIDDRVPEGAYIIGCDPYKDDSQTGTSLASIYVMKTNKYFSTVGHNEIVASYIGRPYLGKNQVNETLHKLSMFYGNAKIYFENNVGNVKDYFEKVRRLDLLATQPVTVFNKKATHLSSPSLIYGYPMSNDKIKWEALQYLRTWLLEVRESSDGKTLRNLDMICDLGLLQELISFNLDGNFDRVMSLLGCIIGLEETTNISKRRERHDQSMTPLREQFKKLFINNSTIFHAGSTQTATIFQKEVGG